MRKSLPILALFTLSLVLWLASNDKETDTADTKRVNSPSAISLKLQPTETLQPFKPHSTAAALHFQTPKHNDELELLPLLEGTEIDGFLAATEEGELVVSLETRDFFDYFLSQADLLENPWHSIEQIHLLAERHLPPPAAEEARHLLDAYLGYQELAYQYLSQPLAPIQQQTPEYQLQVLESAQHELQRLRRQLFEPRIVDAFFAMEEAYADYAILRLELMHNPYLEEDERVAALNQAVTDLPLELRMTEQRHREELQKLP